MAVWGDPREGKPWQPRAALTVLIVMALVGVLLLAMPELFGSILGDESLLNPIRWTGAFAM